jgi:hypothetical protein
MVSADWFMLPLAENNPTTFCSHQINDHHEPSMNVPSVNSDILTNVQIFNDTDSVDKK